MSAEDRPSRGPVVVLAAVVVLIAGAVAAVAGLVGREATGDRIPMAWASVEVAPGGETAVVHHYLPGDEGCEVFRGVEAREVDGRVVVGVWYERTDQEFCIIPCPLGTEARVVAWEPAWQALPIVRHPDTPAHCSEMF